MWYFAQKIDIPSNKSYSSKEGLSQGKDMLSMGFTISLSGLLTSASAFILRVFINDSGGIDDVNDKMKELVNQQALVAILILIPIVVSFLIFSTLIIQILYSEKFMPIEEMIN